MLMRSIIDAIKLIVLSVWLSQTFKFTLTRQSQTKFNVFGTNRKLLKCSTI